MKKLSKIFFSTAATIICLLLILLVVKIINNNKYRKQLPALPDLTNVNRGMRDQIILANSKAYNMPSAGNIGLLGMVYNSNTYYDAATICFRLAARKSSKRWIWNYYLGYLDLEIGNTEEAIRCFKEVSRENPKVPMTEYYLGGAYQNLNMNDSAIKYFSRIADMDESKFLIKNSFRQTYYPLPVFARLRLSRVYMSSGLSDQAEKILKELITSQASFGPAYRQLGILYQQKGDSSLFRYYNSRANDLSSNFQPVDTMIDKITLISRSDEYLIKQIDQAARTSNPYFALYLLDQGLTYMPDNKYFLSRIINGYLALGIPSKTFQYLDTHILFYSNDLKELMEVGHQLLILGFKDKALKYLLKAAYIKTGNAAALSELSVWLNEIGETRIALSLLQELIEKNPEDIRVLSDAVSMFLYRKEQEKALVYLQRLRKLPNSYSNVNIFEGMIAEGLGNRKDALKQYELSFNANPKNKNLINKILKLYNLDKTWDRSISLLNKGLDAFPNDPDIQQRLGDLLINCESRKIINTKEGIDYSNRAFMNYRSPMKLRIIAAKNMAIAYRNLGDLKTAGFYIGSALDMATRSDESKESLTELARLSREITSKL